MSYKSIAIDGPSSAGKSTLARMLAEHMGFLYVDTGAIYRTVGLFIKRCGIAPSDEEGVGALLPSLAVDVKHGDDGQRMFLNGEDVTSEIRAPEISRYASDVSALPAVRDFLLLMQRELAAGNNVIMDGRDIGTVVLPEADLKIYLTASPEERARRRHEEYLSKGEQSDYETVLSELKRRDENDSSRSAAPLRQADGAVLVDTTGNSLGKSFEVLLELTKKELLL